MKYKYYCNDQGFDTYEDASFYAEVLLAQLGIYRCVFTRDEMLANEEVSHVVE